MNRLARHWALLLPLALVSAECALQNGYPFTHPYFSLLFSQETARTSGETALTLFRLLAVYLLLALALETLTRRYRGLLGSTLFAVTYGVILYDSLQDHPAAAVHYVWNPLLTLGLVCALFLYASAKDGTRNPRPLVHSIFLMLGLVFFLALFPAVHWTTTKPGSRTTHGKRPSFLLLGFDSVPADIFFSPQVAPLWSAHWQSKAVQFEKAYATTNSTYTSWFSLLTGRLPFETGVEFLFPARREGHIPTSDMFPQKLSKLGYHTVFMTDCSLTSSMKPEFGFEELYQPEPGPFGCLRSAILSGHPALTGLSRFLPDWFSERNSFCSALYDPASFFQRVAAKLDSLASDEGRPFLLVVHSCLTHHEAVRHVPPRSSSLRESLPLDETASSSLRDLILAQRYADFFADALFRRNGDIWRVLFSDHGLVIGSDWGKKRPFGHGVGLPLNRFQYRVPFAWVAPDSHRRPAPPRRPELVSLADLYPTILELAGEPSPRPHATSLVPSLLGGPPTPARGLLLSSAYPTAPTRIVPAEWNRLRVLNDSIQAPPELEDEVLAQKYVGYLKSGYRLVTNRRGAALIFDEEKDPHAINDLASTLPHQLSALQESLCKEFPSECLSQEGAVNRISSFRNP